MTEIQKAQQLLEKEFGPNWHIIAAQLGTEDLTRRVGKELTSFMAFPERGNEGSNKYRGNCSPKVVEAILKYVLDTKKYYGKDIGNFKLLDPMSGSGTSGAVADKYGIESVLYDLNPNPNRGKGNWNALKDDVEDSADLIFWHPPYDAIIKYSGNMWGTPHPDDLSRCDSYEEFCDKMNLVVRKLFTALRNDGRLAILVGDIRERDRGGFHSMQKDLMRMGEFESFIVKGQFNCVSDTRTYKKPFIPVVTEYMLVYHKDNPIIVPVSWVKNNEFSILEKDYIGLTWNHLIRSVIEYMGGQAKLSDIADMLKEHPKAKKNTHYRERIRATVYEHSSDYINKGNGVYALVY